MDSKNQYIKKLLFFATKYPESLTQFMYTAFCANYSYGLINNVK